tara:strand:- start:902 stop:1306 length:405 start_codon:yes stop_codon:yes gene_type:complete
MRNKILAIFALFALSACSGTRDDISSAWANVTDFSSTSEALESYTSLIEKHSREKWANYSLKTVDTCHIKPEGMTESYLVDMIQENYDQAETCWNMLLEYPTKDVRFYKEGKVEKEVLAEFDAHKEKLASLFKN